MRLLDILVVYIHHKLNKALFLSTFGLSNLLHTRIAKWFETGILGKYAESQYSSQNNVLISRIGKPAELDIFEIFTFFIFFGANCKVLSEGRGYNAMQYQSTAILIYVRKIFLISNNSDPLIRTRTCAYQGVRNVSFTENFA